MKTKLFPLQNARATCLLLCVVALCTSAPRARAQSDSVTVSASEFQRLIYSAHLLTKLEEKPELDASLQVLLELQRRNPYADPVALAGVLTKTLQRYRVGAPAYIRANGCRDEILAAYLEALRQVPAPTNLVPATLQLLNYFMLSPGDRTTNTPTAAGLIYSSNQRLLSAERALAQRVEVVEQCTLRSRASLTFGVAMNSLLLQETGVSLAQSPAEILAADAALSNNQAMRKILERSRLSGDGSLTLSLSELKDLFAQEMQSMRDTINTNLALRLEIVETQTNLTEYLTNTNLISANAQREATVKQGQLARIAAAHAAVNLVGDITTGQFYALGGQMKSIGNAVNRIAVCFQWLSSAKGGQLVTEALSLNLVSVGLELVGTFLPQGPSPDEVILQEIRQVKTLVGELSSNVNYRFDRVDESLREVILKLDESIDWIGGVWHDVDQVRQGLVDVQRGLQRLERQLFTLFNETQRGPFIEAVNWGLFYEADNPGPMSYGDFSAGEGPEAKFYDYATSYALNSISCPSDFPDLAAAINVANQLTLPLDANLNYIKEYLKQILGQETAGAVGQLANPRDWFTSAYAYLQLAVENPACFRKKNRVGAIISVGNNLASFLRSLTFNKDGTNINWDLYNTLLANYSTRFDSFVSQVHSTEQEYASVPLGGFSVDTWRNWAAAAPRPTVTGIALAPLSLALQRITYVAAGTHSLALRSDGTVVGWGENGSGQANGDLAGSNVIAIAAGPYHSLALKADSTVVAWGRNDSNQTDVPPGLSGVVAIAAGGRHSLALKKNGTVVAWGPADFGQASGAPAGSNVVAIAAGQDHSLALKDNGTVVAWGKNTGHQTNVPPGLSGVMAIAGGASHSLALKSNGTVVAWGDNTYGQTNVPPGLSNVVAIRAGAWHSLALQADGCLVSWGAQGTADVGQVAIPASATQVVAIAAGPSHNLALKADGTVLAWGESLFERCAVPGSPPGGTVAVAAGLEHSLALKADGTVVGWGFNNSGQADGTRAGGSVIAIDAGYNHSLALRADGSLIAWGHNANGQTAIPAGLANVVAIAVGPFHNLALKADGTVSVWGQNDAGQLNIPSGLDNVVAIATGEYHSLALKSNGEVVACGANESGQCNVPGDAKSGVVAIAAGGYFCRKSFFVYEHRGHSLALKADGRVISWGDNSLGQRNVPAAALSGVVAIAARGAESLALKADGTVVHWGPVGATPSGLSNVVAIAVGGWVGYRVTNLGFGFILEPHEFCLAVKRDGQVVAWGENDYGQRDVPTSALRYESPAQCVRYSLTLSNHTERLDTGLTKVAAGLDYSLALRTNGSLVAWGINEVGQCLVPRGLVGVAEIAAGPRHSLTLTKNGSVLAWGWNAYGQTNVPIEAWSDVIAISAGGAHSLALKTDGSVKAWGWNAYGQTNVPLAAKSDVVAVSAGGQHSLALKADTTVVAWGCNAAGQTNVPPLLNRVIAIAAGDQHSLALLDTGEVLGWGGNVCDQISVPLAAKSGVVAIAALKNHSLALKRDGTVVAWGQNTYDQTKLPATLSNVLAVAAGARHNVFLTSADQVAGSAGTPVTFVLANTPREVVNRLGKVNAKLVEELEAGGSLRTKGIELSGAKALIQAVLELGMPYTMERNDVLRGFFYGTEALADLGIARNLFSAETNNLATAPNARPMILEEMVSPRFFCFVAQLAESLNNLEATGQPETPRMVGHTLRLLNLLGEAWQPVPSPTLEIGRQTNGLSLVLYGEPYVHYTLQYSPQVSAAGWSTLSMPTLQFQTNLHNQELIAPPVSGSPQRFYRGLLPAQ